MEGAVSEKRKAFAAAHRNDEDRQAYISASRRTSSVIAKAKAETWQTTRSSLSPKSNPKSMHSLLRSIAGSASSFPSSPNFPNCSSPRESALVYTAYLRSHLSVSQPKALHSRARGYFSELRRATCPEQSHLSFCSPFSPTEFLATPAALIRLQHWRLRFNPSRCKAFFISVDPHHDNFQLHYYLCNSFLRVNPASPFLGVIFDCTLSFSAKYLR